MSVIDALIQTNITSVTSVPETPEAQAVEASAPNDGLIRLPEGASEEERLALLGVDLDKYPSVHERTFYNPIISRQNRELYWTLTKAWTRKLLGLVPDPTMITHIVTTRCNYSCGFCSFADTLNAKTSELSLDEIEQTYATLGNNLNTIVYSGGETTINKNLAEIIEAAYRLTPVKSVYIISNAWKPELIFQITHRIKQRCPGLHLTWSLSIEGPKYHNNRVRHTRAANWDAWQNTVDTAEGLKAIRERFGYQELDIQMCTVCTPENTAILEDWYAMVRDVLKPDKWNLNLMRKSVQMTQSELASFEERRKTRVLEPFEAKYIEITEKIRADVLNGNLNFRYNTENRIDGAVKAAVDLISQAENRRVTQEEPKLDKQLFCCQAGRHGAFIGSEGEVSGCEEFAMNPDPAQNKRYGNLRDVHFNFHQIWHSERAKALREKTGRSAECYGCTLESQRNYPSILVSFASMKEAFRLGKHILLQS